MQSIPACFKYRELWPMRKKIRHVNWPVCSVVGWMWPDSRLRVAKSNAPARMYKQNVFEVQLERRHVHCGMACGTYIHRALCLTFYRPRINPGSIYMVDSVLAVLGCFVPTSSAVCSIGNSPAHALRGIAFCRA